MNVLQKKFRGLGGKMEKNCSAGYGCNSGLSDRLNSFGFGVWPKPISF